MTESSGEPAYQEGLARVGLLLSGVACWWGATTVFEGGNPAQYPFAHALVLGGFLWGFLLLGAASLSRPPMRWVTALVSVGAVLVFCDHAVVQAEIGRFMGTPPTTDVRVYMDYAAWLLLEGENPYQHDLTAAYGPHRATLQYATPLTDGGLTGKLAYPALSFLVHVPTLLLGVSDRWVYLGFLLASMCALMVYARPMYRPIVLLPFLMEPRFVGYAFSGVSDNLWAFLLVMAVANWRRPWARGVFLGLACAAKQHPWILAPFLAIRVWTETDGDRRAKATAVAKLVGWSVLAFLVVNLPFVIWDPAAWLSGVLEPLSASMITWGTGLSALTAWGVLDLPRGLWSFTFYGALILGLFAYGRHASRIGEAVWLLPGLALFFGHRSLNSYWYFELFPMVMALAVTMPTNPTRSANWRPTAALVGGYVAVVVGAMVFFANQAPVLEVMVGRPMWVAGHRVNQLLIGVRNLSDEPIEPRFQVQTTAEQPLYWDVRSGPEHLGAHEVATYVVGTRVPFKTFDMARGAVVSVSDAGAYWPRTAVKIRPDAAFARPDRIPNPSFAYWADGGSRPQFWEVHHNGRGAARWIDQRGGVQLSLSPGLQSEVSLRTSVLDPGAPIGLLIHPPEAANQLPELNQRYGVALRVGDEVGLVLFGDEEGSGQLKDGRPWVMRAAKRDAWSAVSIDIAAAIHDLGIEWPSERIRLGRFRHLDFPMRSVSVELTFEADTLNTDAVAVFGPFTDGAESLPAERYGREIETVTHAVWLAELELQSRNEERASVLLGESGEDLAALYVHLADRAIADGSRMEAIQFVDAAWQYPLTGASLRAVVGVYERLDLGGDAEQLVLATIERAQRLDDAALQRDAWMALAELAGGHGDCPKAEHALAKAATLGEDVPELEDIHEACVDAQ